MQSECKSVSAHMSGLPHFIVFSIITACKNTLSSSGSELTVQQKCISKWVKVDV